MKVTVKEVLAQLSNKEYTKKRLSEMLGSDNLGESVEYYLRMIRLSYPYYLENMESLDDNEAANLLKVLDDVTGVVTKELRRLAKAFGTQNK